MPTFPSFGKQRHSFVLKILLLLLLFGLELLLLIRITSFEVFINDRRLAGNRHGMLSALGSSIAALMCWSSLTESNQMPAYGMVTRFRIRIRLFVRCEVDELDVCGWMNGTNDQCFFISSKQNHCTSLNSYDSIFVLFFFILKNTCCFD